MQLFIGGACAGKCDAVSERFPAARWHRLEAGTRLPDWRETVVAEVPLVVTGWADWIEMALSDEPDDDRLREQLVAALEALVAVERERGTTVIVILPEMGRGIVPMAARLRRLRDLAGWLAQDTAERAEAVWYVRHGLVKSLK
ncbi:bifunctional adenosylcobinamide kinase/adenosylcobinamide-phosphate guanylyltransferase [Halomonas faecis]|uniref:bifunctional adenosylcobinamide kinase/adenosylcobinamide-phosphate guanylyltransferase n=1 Tax=Halomonas faecis TaxID=1562110 RepID=UPI0013D2D4F7|nr:bifunctional adenosylcobinamide kinase/adenosylcobinamide-phosphate guanylyltransferase [Halomonas faecis]